MEIKLNGRGPFPQVTWFLHSLPLIGHNLLLVYYHFEYKGNFYKYGLYYTWVQMLLQIGPLLHLGSKCYYGWDFYYAWVQMLLQMGPLLHLGPIITHVPSSPRNDPDPEMIPNLEMIPEWSPFLFMLTPKWSPINSWNGTCIPSRNYYKSVAEFTFLIRV